jgi:hypothetical protein
MLQRRVYIRGMTDSNETNYPPGNLLLADKSGAVDSNMSDSRRARYAVSHE